MAIYPQQAFGLEPVPRTYRAAQERGQAIRRFTYDSNKCLIEIISDGDNWKLTVTRISDSDQTIELISKE